MSNTAGTFVCNHIFYALMHRLAAQAGNATGAGSVRGGFIHVPALPALAALSASYPVVALSNGNADVHRVGIGQFFRGAVNATQIGVGKPDRRIFTAAAQAAGVPESAVLHVGDDAHLDGAGALAAGMQVAWINRGGEHWPAAIPGRPHAVASDMRALCVLLGAETAHQD